MAFLKYTSQEQNIVPKWKENILENTKSLLFSQCFIFNLKFMVSIIAFPFNQTKQQKLLRNSSLRRCGFRNKIFDITPGWNNELWSFIYCMALLVSLLQASKRKKYWKNETLSWIKSQRQQHQVGFNFHFDTHTQFSVLSFLFICLLLSSAYK